MKYGTQSQTCPECGKGHISVRAICRTCASTTVSATPGTLDDMIEKASRPSLASLIERGLKSGAIKPVADYGPDHSKP